MVALDENPDVPDKPSSALGIDHILSPDFLSRLDGLLKVLTEGGALAQLAVRETQAQIAYACSREKPIMVDERVQFQDTEKQMAGAIAGIRTFINMASTNLEAVRGKSTKDFLEFIEPMQRLHSWLEEYESMPELRNLLQPICGLTTAINDADCMLLSAEGYETRPIMSLLEEWDAFRQSGISYDEYKNNRKRVLQLEVDKIMEGLSTLDVSDTEAVWQWLLALSSHAQFAGITINRGVLLNFLSNNGFFFPQTATSSPQKDEIDPTLFAQRAIEAHIRGYCDLQGHACFAPHIVQKNYQHWQALRARAEGGHNEGKSTLAEWH